MKHPAELALHQYLADAVNGKTTMSESTIERISKDVTDAVRRQFGSGKGRKEFGLRMSNIGKPTCQLWFEKNEPEKALPKPTTFMFNMMLGDIVEAVFKGALTEAGIAFEECKEPVALKLGAATVNGTYDLVINGAVDDVKSASPWSYTNKFDSYETLRSGDSFGYVGQLAGYAKASGKKAGGWWVVNKANGDFKYVSAAEADVEQTMADIKDTYEYISQDKPFERCFDAEPETYRGKASGNWKLSKTCGFCDHKKKCWPELQALPSRVYKGAKTPPTVEYVSLGSQT